MRITRRQGLGLIAAGTVACLPIHRALAGAGDTGSKLILLGTGGGPTPLPGRNQPASVLVVNDVPYVIDAGNGVGRQLMLAGIGLHRIGKIFITHHHDDHNADLGTLMGLAWSNGRTEQIDAYGPPGTDRMIAAYLDYFRPNADLRIAFDGRTLDPAQIFRGHDIAPGLVYEDDNLRVTAVENTHYPDSGHVDDAHHVSFSYRFDTPDRSIVFSGDTAKSDQLIELAKGADILVHEVLHPERTTALFTQKFAEQGRPPEEAAHVLKAVIAIHTTVEQVGEVAAAAGVKTVVLNHFVPGFDPDETEEQWITDLRKHFSGKVVIGQDLMVL